MSRMCLVHRNIESAAAGYFYFIESSMQRGSRISMTMRLNQRILYFRYFTKSQSSTLKEDILGELPFTLHLSSTFFSYLNGQLLLREPRPQLYSSPVRVSILRDR